MELWEKYVRAWDFGLEKQLDALSGINGAILSKNMEDFMIWTMGLV